jgi:hypothetical protein
VVNPTDGSVVNFLGPDTSPSRGNAAGIGTDMIFGQVQLEDLSVATSYTDNYTIPYTFAVTLTDLDTSTTHVFDISGTLTGFIRDINGVFSSQFTNTYTSPLTQSATLGVPTDQTTYTITVANASGFFTAPSPPLFDDDVSGTNGRFAFNVDGFSPSAAVPEPGSSGLVAVGVSILAISRRRRSAPRLGRR